MTIPAIMQGQVPRTTSSTSGSSSTPAPIRSDGNDIYNGGNLQDLQNAQVLQSLNQHTGTGMGGQDSQFSSGNHSAMLQQKQQHIMHAHAIGQQDSVNANTAALQQQQQHLIHAHAIGQQDSANANAAALQHQQLMHAYAVGQLDSAANANAASLQQQQLMHVHAIGQQDAANANAAALQQQHQQQQLMHAHAVGHQDAANANAAALQQQHQQQQLMHAHAVGQQDAANANAALHQVPQNHMVPQVQQVTATPVVQQKKRPGSGQQVMVAAQLGRFSIIQDVPTDSSTGGETSQVQGLNASIITEEGSLNHQVQQQQVGMNPSMNASQHLTQNLAQPLIAGTAEQANRMISASAPSSRVIQSGAVMPPSPITMTPAGRPGTKIKGRFIVSTSADTGGTKQHVRANSVGASPDQIQQMRASIGGQQLNHPQQVAPLPPSQQQGVQIKQAPVQPGQQTVHTQVVDGQTTIGIYSAQTVHNTGALPPLEYVHPSGAIIPQIALGNKPPMTPKPPNSGSVSKGGLSSAMPGTMGKMFHFLDQLKMEVVEADKIVKSLQSDVKVLVSRRCKCF